jgi:hypothetical protein
MTADLAEEHSTSTLATERLEAETADRLRLEKELQDVQVRRVSHVVLMSCHHFILQTKICVSVDFFLYRYQIFYPECLELWVFWIQGFLYLELHA